jgi:Protein of unknown function (DUF1570)
MRVQIEAALREHTIGHSRTGGCYILRALRDSVVNSAFPTGGSATEARRMKRVVLVLLISILSFTIPARAEMKRYDSRYYIIYTDLDTDGVKEAIVRMTHMAEEYHERTKSFSGALRQKFPFYLYRSPEDYYANGGIPGSAGVFISDQSGGKLMAIAGQKTTLNTWHVVQHEGFHQFAHAVIGGDIPTWLNEGLAEYFGEGIFTGDGFITGVVPPWRLERLKQEINDNKLMPAEKIMFISSEQWRTQMKIENYDQAWSMVHFLVHGDSEKYQQAFGACIREISAGKPFQRAWLDTIGSANGFEDRWKAWWLSQPASPTSLLYARADVAILTSFLGRATAQKQTFDSFAGFESSAEANELKIDPQDWLPPSLLEVGVRSIESASQWEIHAGTNKRPVLVRTLDDGTILSGSFILNGPRVDHIAVDIDDLAKVMNDAQVLYNGGKKAEAKSMLAKALAQQSKSTSAAAAKKLLVEWK